MSDIEDEATTAMLKHHLKPIREPLGEDHHTGEPFTEEDKEIGQLAYWLGGLFIDHEDGCPDRPYRETYFYKEMTSQDVWTRVARALRIHGLRIVNR